MSKPKTVLPDNWRPCEVNQAPDLNQYEINERSAQIYRSFWQFDYENGTDADLGKDAMFVTLYTDADIRCLFLSPNFLPHNFKNFIDAN
jgi:hypothetical protein